MARTNRDAAITLIEIQRHLRLMLADHDIGCFHLHLSERLQPIPR